MTAEMGNAPGHDKKTEPLSIERNMLWNSAGSIVNLGCQYLIGIVVVRLTNGFEAAGIYSLALSVFYVFSPVAIYRMNIVQISDVRGENSTGEYLTFTALTCGIALALTVVYMVLTCDASTWLSIVLFLLYRYVMVLITVFHGCCQLHMRMDYNGKSNMLQGVASLVVFSAGYVFTQSLPATFAAMGIAMALIAILYSYPRARYFGPIEFGIEWRKALHLLFSCAPIVLAGVMLGMAGSVPKQYLSATMGAAALGAYASVSQPVNIIQAGAACIYLPLIGSFSRAYDEENWDRFRRLIARLALGLLVVFVACFAGIALFGKALLVLLCGEQISPYTYLLGPLGAYIMVSAIAALLNDLTIALRSYFSSFIGGASQLLVALLFMVPCIEGLGLAGVSLVGILSSLCSAIVSIVALYFHMRSHSRHAH